MFDKMLETLETATKSVDAAQTQYDMLELMNLYLLLSELRLRLSDLILMKLSKLEPP